MEIIDTNILSYKFKNTNYQISLDDKHISSINALEFLKNIEKIRSNSAKYYIPLDKTGRFNSMFDSMGAHSGRPFNKTSSDSILFQFNNEFSSYNLYNNLSMQNAINDKRSELLKASIHFLPKDLYKYIYQRYLYLINKNIKCIALNNEDIELALELLNKFVIHHSLKGDFRNSWNDLLIAATAVNRNCNLITSDKTLHRFVASEFDIKHNSVFKNVVEYDFSKRSVLEMKHNKFESKGYINRSWGYLLRKN
jgi:predicted nucleic acid-binding protein